MWVATPEDFVTSQVKAKGLKVVPSAEVILFGSRAQGDSSKYADRDFMVVTYQKLTDVEQKAIFHAIFELESARSIEIQLIYKTRDEFEA